MAAARPGSWQTFQCLKSEIGSPPLAGGRRAGSSRSIPVAQLTGTIMGAFMSYVLVPQEPDGTRLLLKVVARTNRWAAFGLSIGDLIMSRRQLLNLKHLAECHQHQATARN